VRQPFQVSLRMQYAIGFDQRTQQLQQLGNRNGVGGATTGPAMLDSVMVRFKRSDVALNTIARTELVLSKTQIAELQALSDSTQVKLRTSIDSIRPDVEKVNLAGSAADLGPLMQKLGPFTFGLLAIQRAERDAVQKILTDVQWALLPETVKNPQMNLLGNGRGGPGGATTGGGAPRGGRAGGGGL